MSLSNSGFGLHSDEAAMALFRASKYGQINDVKNILAFVENSDDFVNAANVFTGWTSLTIACIKGHIEIVKLLLQAGARQGLCDRAGWTERDYAVIHGHLAIARFLVSHGILTQHTPVQVESLYQLDIRSRDYIGRQAKRKLKMPPHLKSERAFPEFRSIDQEHDLLLVTIGPSNTRSNLSLLDLVEGANDHDSKFSVRVTMEDLLCTSSRQQHLINLPVQGNVANQPLVLRTKNVYESSLTFEIFESPAANKRSTRALGSGTALIESLRPGLAPNHESLARDHTIPILENGSMAHIGSITFSLLIVTAFQCPMPPPKTSLGFWRKDGSTQVVGHRGSGANSSKHQSLQIRENTVQSLLSATALGASCVEFDVQLTKDFVPVISHDFLVMETGGDIPLHALTLDQFMHVNRTRPPKVGPQNVSDGEETEASVSKGVIKSKPRSRSAGACNHSHNHGLIERMRFTEHNLHHPMKDSERHWQIHQPSATLEQVLLKVPASVPFNVEIKYPMLWETEDRGMEYTAIEINHFVDTILTTVFKLCGNRDITFSSFSPEICILLACKQTTFPILFISKAGSVPTGDIRAGSLKGAIEFAKTWGLAGIVMLADIFVMCPRLLAYAKDSGLVVGTYGDLNDDPDCALIQADAGLDAIVTNKIRLISQTLREGQP